MNRFRQTIRVIAEPGGLAARVPRARAILACAWADGLAIAVLRTLADSEWRRGLVGPRGKHRAQARADAYPAAVDVMLDSCGTVLLAFGPSVSLDDAGKLLGTLGGWHMDRAVWAIVEPSELQALADSILPRIDVEPHSELPQNILYSIDVEKHVVAVIELADDDWEIHCNDAAWIAKLAACLTERGLVVT